VDLRSKHAHRRKEGRLRDPPRCPAKNAERYPKTQNRTRPGGHHEKRLGGSGTSLSGGDGEEKFEEGDGT